MCGYLSLLLSAVTGPSKPVLASQYSVRVEANLGEANRTVDAHEFYDSINNRGALLQWDRGVETRVLFDFSTNQLITVTLPNRAGTCLFHPSPEHDARATTCLYPRLSMMYVVSSPLV